MKWFLGGVSFLSAVVILGWFTWFLDCDNLRISGVKMYADLRLPNTDGIHLGSCRHVVISDCDLRTGDDSIVIRSMQEQFSEPKRSGVKTSLSLIVF